ncbi:hypothetical protein MMC13_003379 [Lambiella insularis]|nr:hypothetical protein [Lambiella insularis]
MAHQSFQRFTREDCRDYIIYELGERRKMPQALPFESGIGKLMDRLDRRYGEGCQVQYTEIVDKLLEFPDPAVPSADEAQMYNHWRGPYKKAKAEQIGSHIDWNYQRELTMVSGREATKGMAETEFTRNLEPRNLEMPGDEAGAQAGRETLPWPADSTPWEGYIAPHVDPPVHQEHSGARVLSIPIKTAEEKAAEEVAKAEAEEKARIARMKWRQIMRPLSWIGMPVADRLERSGYERTAKCVSKIFE